MKMLAGPSLRGKVGTLVLALLGLSSNAAQLVPDSDWVAREASGQAQLARWCNATLPAQQARREALQRLLEQAQTLSGPPLQLVEEDALKLGGELEQNRISTQASQAEWRRRLAAAALENDDSTLDAKVLREVEGRFVGNKGSPEWALVQQLEQQSQKSAQKLKQQLQMLQVAGQTSQAASAGARLEAQYQQKRANISELQQQYFTAQRSLGLLVSALEDESAYLSDLQTVCGLVDHIHRRLDADTLPALRHALADAAAAASKTTPAPATASAPTAAPAPPPHPALASALSALPATPPLPPPAAAVSATATAAVPPAVPQTVSKAAAPTAAAPAAAAPAAVPATAVPTAAASVPAPPAKAAPAVAATPAAVTAKAAPVSPPARAVAAPSASKSAAPAAPLAPVAPVATTKLRGAALVAAPKSARKAKVEVNAETVAKAKAELEEAEDDVEAEEAKPKAVAKKAVKAAKVPTKAAAVKAAAKAAPAKVPSAAAMLQKTSPPKAPRALADSPAKATPATAAPAKAADPADDADEEDADMQLIEGTAAAQTPKAAPATAAAEPAAATAAAPPAAKATAKAASAPAKAAPTGAKHASKKAKEVKDAPVPVTIVPNVYKPWSPDGTSADDDAADTTPAPLAGSGSETQKMMALFAADSDDDADPPMPKAKSKAKALVHSAAKAKPVAHKEKVIATTAAPVPVAPASDDQDAVSADDSEAPSATHAAHAGHAAKAQQAAKAVDADVDESLADDDEEVHAKPAEKKHGGAHAVKKSVALDEQDAEPEKDGDEVAEASEPAPVSRRHRPTAAPTTAAPAAASSEADDDDDSLLVPPAPRAASPKPRAREAEPAAQDDGNDDADAPAPPPARKHHATPTAETAAVPAPAPRRLKPASDANLPGEYNAWTPADGRPGAKHDAAFAKLAAELGDDDSDAEGEAPAPAPAAKRAGKAARSSKGAAPASSKKGAVVYDDDDLPKHHARPISEELRGGWQSFLTRKKGDHGPHAKLDADVQIMQSLYANGGALPKQYSAWTPSTPSPPAAPAGDDGDDGAAAPASKDQDSEDDAPQSTDLVALAAKELKEDGGAAALVQLSSKVRLRVAPSAAAARAAVASALLDGFSKELGSPALHKLAQAKLAPSTLADLVRQLRTASDTAQAEADAESVRKQQQAYQWCLYFLEHEQSAVPLREAVARKETARNLLTEAAAQRASVVEEREARTQLSRTVEQDVRSITTILSRLRQDVATPTLAPGAPAQDLVVLARASAQLEGAQLEVADALEATVQKRLAVLQAQKTKLAELTKNAMEAEHTYETRREESARFDGELEATKKKLAGIQSSCDLTIGGLERHRHTSHQQERAVTMALQVLSGK